MTRVASMRPLAVAMAVLAPTFSHAAASLSLVFTGTASPGSSGTVFPYDPAFMSESTSFAGEPVRISLSIAGPPEHLYVSSFSTSWSNETYSLPFITSASGDGLPMSPENDPIADFYSTVALSGHDGSIQIFPTPGFIGQTDSDFTLNFTYALTGAGHPYSSSGGGVTGSGNIHADLSFRNDPVIGPFDASSNVDFTLSNLSEAGAVPEPATWTMLLLGFAALGAAVRSRRLHPEIGR